MDERCPEGHALGVCWRFGEAQFFILGAIALISRVTSARFLGIPFSIVGPIWYITLVATFVFHIVVWRCPSCRSYLGITRKPKYCPKCGFRYNGGPDE